MSEALRIIRNPLNMTDPRLKEAIDFVEKKLDRAGYWGNALHKFMIETFNNSEHYLS